MITAAAIEPVLPEQGIVPLEDAAMQVVEKAAALGQKVRPAFVAELRKITRWLHCYYSNAIEDQPTRVRDIEAALKKELVAAPKQRNLQLLALAHLDCQEWASHYDGSPFADDFFRELHRRFYSALPAEMRVATTASGKTVPLEPGEFRNRDVEVGTHVPPPHELVRPMLDHMRRRYSEPSLSRARRIIAAAASHHRFAWIHPFRDGNGRVVRLFSDTLLRQNGVDAGGLWSLSRGLAIHRDEYYARLANADQERSSTSAADGRGHLSERALHEFCEFMLRVMLDQLSFMESAFDLDGLTTRIERYVKLEAPELGDNAERVFLLLREALYRGEFPRGEAARVIGAGERTARSVVSVALRLELLASDSHKSPLRLALPSKVLSTYLPRLFPLVD